MLSALSSRKPASSGNDSQVAAAAEDALPKVAAVVAVDDAPTRPDTAAVSARSRTASALIRSGFMDRAPPTADAADASPPPPLANTADVFIEDADADADDDTLSCDAEKV